MSLDKPADRATGPSGHYSDQQSIDAECERLLRSTKRQVKQMMEEAVTRKFIHEESSSIISLCVAVDACLSHGLKRRALGLFKTNSSTALVQKVAKNCRSAQEVLSLVDDEERRSQQLGRKLSSAAAQAEPQTGNRSPLRQRASSTSVHRRNLWIRCALIERKLVSIVEHLAENAPKYYEPEALMANYLSAQILCSLLVGPCALEFSRSKTSDCYQFEEPSADELLNRHKLSNPIACLCSSHRQPPANQSRSVSPTSPQRLGQLSGSATDTPATRADEQSSRDESPLLSRRESRRRPLALKTNIKTATLVTECHHLSCQDIDEHQQPRGYSFKCLSSNGMSQTSQSAQPSAGHLQASACCHGLEWSMWSPRMLHETLHQNSKSNLLYAKNNVLLETQPHKFMAGYLSLHETSSDLILKWIPNQMINGGQKAPSSASDPSDPVDGKEESSAGDFGESDDASQCDGVVESSYLDYVLSLSVSRIVLLHCQLSARGQRQDSADRPDASSGSAEPTDEPLEPAARLTARRSPSNEETLILVEADGVQRAPFKFPKGGLRLFLSCLESGLKPDRYLDPAIKPDCLDPLQSPVESVSCPASASDANQASASRLDLLLKRLPSLRRSTKSSADSTESQPSASQPNEAGPSSRAASPDRGPAPNDAEQVSQLATMSNYVYRIVALQQPEWPLLTPPHSALSVGSPSGVNSAAGRQRQAAARGQKFRWSLSRLARFSARYTNSGSTSSNQTNGSLSNSLSYNQATLENSSICDNQDSGSLNEQTSASGQQSKDNSRELARIEAKLDDLKRSTSDDLMALRTQSIQTLCDSMRQQIVARAFYGWLAYCRRARIIRMHLMKLVHETSLLLDDLEEPAAGYPARLGLTRANWHELVSDERHTNDEIQKRIVFQSVYYGGIESDELRREVWPYLLGHYEFADTKEMREAKDKYVRESYEACGMEWIKIERVVKKRDREILAANMARASNDSTKSNRSNKPIETSGDERQNDNNHVKDSNKKEDSLQPDISEDNELYQSGEELPEDEAKPGEVGNEDNPREDKRVKTGKTKEVTKLATTKRTRRRARLESTGSVGSDASITDQFGNNIHRIDKDVQRCDRNFWYFKDVKNLDKLRNIMCSYVWQHLDVGYVQGMCDLAAPFLVIFDDEILAFSCFSQLMKRMVSNFPHGNSMDQHFESLKYLMQVLDPKLFEVLQNNGDYTHFYFCYRWLLLDFKRELAYADVYKVWETIWSARYIATDHFVVFMALAMVRYYRDIIIENNMDFTDTIKFFNELAERHDADKIIALARDCVVELATLIKNA